MYYSSTSQHGATEFHAQALGKPKEVATAVGRGLIGGGGAERCVHCKDNSGGKGIIDLWCLVATPGSDPEKD